MKMAISIKYWPLATVALLCGTLCVTSFLSLRERHVTDSIPYISDMGTLPPEACIFGQALNLLWIMISFVIYIKYRQISYLLSIHNMEKFETMNRRTVILGLLAAAGSSIVANFQETNMLLVHWIGATLVFGLGSIYQCMQTIIYIRLASILGQKKLIKLRIGISVISITSFLVLFVGAQIAYFQKKVSGNYLHWKKSDGGYECHNISVVAEWICGSSTMMYLMLFSEEFKNITLHQPKVSVKTDNVVQIASITELK